MAYAGGEEVKPESEVQSLVRLEAAKKMIRLWRNNVGAGTLKNGAFIRWGLCNESAAVNDRMKSSDLIGIRAVKITPDMVGRTIGVFVARECKREGWVYTGDEVEEAQLRFLHLIRDMGGDAGFATGEGTL